MPTGYDPMTLNHWLWFKYQCHECSPTEFQRLFENIMKRAKPDFVQIRSYGSIGDRKCDGLFLADGTVFQVYSPDEIRQSELKKKIDEDLDGAFGHWGDKLRNWTFVYNVRRGLPPDIARILQEKRRLFPTVNVQALSSDGLWEIARGLSLQQRAEVLGAPAGYEPLFFVPNIASEEVRHCVEKSWFVFVQDVLAPINLKAVTDALDPEFPFGAPAFLRPTQGEPPWDDAADYQSQVVAEAMMRARDLVPRFAVFSLAPIPLAIHLGFALSDRVEVKYFQFDRETASWRWPAAGTVEADETVTISGLPDQEVRDEVEIAVRISLSAKISPWEAQSVSGRLPIEIDLSVARPDVRWLRSPVQLKILGQSFLNVLAALRERVPRASRLHLFYAGPTGGAIVLGQQVNPRMNPPVEVYEYSRQASPRYQRALTLRGR